jgi:hypothetical protein
MQRSPAKATHEVCAVSSMGEIYPGKISMSILSG